MIDSASDRSFATDSRGVATVVGAVLILGFLVLALTVYQASIVPAQNKDVEFTHSQSVEPELLDLRNALTNTRANGISESVRIRLGTTYPDRLIAINPPDPAGTLRTTQPTPINVSNGSGTNLATAVCENCNETRSLTYTPQYNEFTQRASYGIEHTVLFRQFDDGRTLPVSGQRLVQGDHIRLSPLTSDYQASRTGAVSVETRTGPVRTTTVTDPTITLNTSLSERHWKDLLDGEVAAENVTVTNEQLTLSLSGQYTVSYATLALDEAPPDGDRETGVSDTGGNGGDDPGEINPATKGSVKLADVALDDPEFTLTFNNTGEDINVTAGRINFYYAENKNNNPTKATVKDNVPTEYGTLVIGDPSSSFSPKIELMGSTETEIIFAFDNDSNNVKVNDRDWFIITLEFDTGDTRRYFVSD